MGGTDGEVVDVSAVFVIPSSLSRLSSDSVEEADGEIVDDPIVLVIAGDKSFVGDAVNGASVGSFEGVSDGFWVGFLDGAMEGADVISVGCDVASDGFCVGF